MPAGGWTSFDREQERIESVRLEGRLSQQLAQAELRALRAQINPHFLFNSLNTIAALIVSEPEKAEMITMRLSSIFRYVLLHADRPLSSLDEEMGFLRTYLDIEQIRFGERLLVEFDVESSITQTAVPTLILQPLVENAIKHGVARKGGQMSNSGGGEAPRRFHPAQRRRRWGSACSRNGARAAGHCWAPSPVRALACRISGRGSKPCMAEMRSFRWSTYTAAVVGQRWRFLLRRNEMQIRAFLADDEHAARLRLRRLLTRHPQIGIVGEAGDGPGALEAIERLRPELLFLDVSNAWVEWLCFFRNLFSPDHRVSTFF